MQMVGLVPEIAALIGMLTLIKVGEWLDHFSQVMILLDVLVDVSWRNVGALVPLMEFGTNFLEVLVGF